MTPRTTEEWLEQNKARAFRYRTATAYHEGGHVLAAKQLGLGIRGATIVPSLSYWGQARVGVRYAEDEFSDSFWRAIEGGAVSPRTRRKVEADIMTTMAGYIAERRALELGLAQLPEPPSDPVERSAEERKAQLEKIMLDTAAREPASTG